eukprot:Clim_evm41s151 gene=Clim_evmTU41s151
MAVDKENPIKGLNGTRLRGGKSIQTRQSLPPVYYKPAANGPWHEQKTSRHRNEDIERMILEGICSPKPSLPWIVADLLHDDNNQGEDLHRGLSLTGNDTRKRLRQRAEEWEAPMLDHLRACDKLFRNRVHGSSGAFVGRMDALRKDIAQIQYALREVKKTRWSLRSLDATATKSHLCLVGLTRRRERLMAVQKYVSKLSALGKVRRDAMELLANDRPMEAHILCDRMSQTVNQELGDLVAAQALMPELYHLQTAIDDGLNHTMHKMARMPIFDAKLFSDVVQLKLLYQLERRHHHNVLQNKNGVSEGSEEVGIEPPRITTISTLIKEVQPIIRLQYRHISAALAADLQEIVVLHSGGRGTPLMGVPSEVTLSQRDSSLPNVPERYSDAVNGLLKQGSGRVKSCLRQLTLRAVQSMESVHALRVSLSQRYILDRWYLGLCLQMTGDPEDERPDPKPLEENPAVLSTTLEEFVRFLNAEDSAVWLVVDAYIVCLCTLLEKALRNKLEGIADPQNGDWVLPLEEWDIEPEMYQVISILTHLEDLSRDFKNRNDHKYRLGASVSRLSGLFVDFVFYRQIENLDAMLKADSWQSCPSGPWPGMPRLLEQITALTGTESIVKEANTIEESRKHMDEAFERPRIDAKTFVSLFETLVAQQCPNRVRLQSVIRCRPDLFLPRSNGGLNTNHVDRGLGLGAAATSFHATEENTGDIFRGQSARTYELSPVTPSTMALLRYAKSNLQQMTRMPCLIGPVIEATTSLLEQYTFAVWTFFGRPFGDKVPSWHRTTVEGLRNRRAHLRQRCLERDEGWATDRPEVYKKTQAFEGSGAYQDTSSEHTAALEGLSHTAGSPHDKTSLTRRQQQWQRGTRKEEEVTLMEAHTHVIFNRHAMRRFSVTPYRPLDPDLFDVLLLLEHQAMEVDLESGAESMDMDTMEVRRSIENLSSTLERFPLPFEMRLNPDQVSSAIVLDAATDCYGLRERSTALDSLEVIAQDLVPLAETLQRALKDLWITASPSFSYLEGPTNNGDYTPNATAEECFYEQAPFLALNDRHGQHFRAVSPHCGNDCTSRDENGSQSDGNDVCMMWTRAAGAKFLALVRALPALRTQAYANYAGSLLSVPRLISTIAATRYDLRDMAEHQSAWTDEFLAEAEPVLQRLADYTAAEYIPQEVYRQILAATQTVLSDALVEGYSCVERVTTEGRGLQQVDWEHLQSRLSCIGGTNIGFGASERTEIFDRTHREHVDDYLRAYYLNRGQFEDWLEHSGRRYTADQLRALLQTGTTEPPNIAREDRAILLDRVDAMFGSD